MLSELQTATRVADRLRSRFPGAPLTVIKDTVAAAQHKYASATVRGYLPVLIERAARAAILRIGYQEARDVRDTASGRPGPLIPAGHVPMETVFNARGDAYRRMGRLMRLLDDANADCSDTDATQLVPADAVRR